MAYRHTGLEHAQKHRAGRQPLSWEVIIYIKNKKRKGLSPAPDGASDLRSRRPHSLDILQPSQGGSSRVIYIRSIRR